MRGRERTMKQQQVQDIVQRNRRLVGGMMENYAAVSAQVVQEEREIHGARSITKLVATVLCVVVVVLAILGTVAWVMQ